MCRSNHGARRYRAQGRIVRPGSCRHCDNRHSLLRRRALWRCSRSFNRVGMCSVRPGISAYCGRICSRWAPGRQYAQLWQACFCHWVHRRGWTACVPGIGKEECVALCSRAGPCRFAVPPHPWKRLAKSSQIAAPSSQKAGGRRGGTCQESPGAFVSEAGGLLKSI